MNKAEIIVVDDLNNKKVVDIISIGNNCPVVNSFIVNRGNTYKVNEVTYNYDTKVIYLLCSECK